MPPTLEPYEQLLLGTGLTVLLPAAVFYVLGYTALATDLHRILPERWEARLDRGVDRAGTVTYFAAAAIVFVAVGIAARLIAANLIIPNLTH